MTQKGTNMRNNLRIKKVMRLDTIQRHFRLFRIMWERGKVGDGNGYSAKLSVGLEPQISRWERQAGTDWLVTVVGVRVHYCRSYGGIFA